MNETDEYIHTVVLGNDCWHDRKDGRRGQDICSKCGFEWDDPWATNPAYSTSLDLLAPVEKLTVEKFGAYEYLKTLVETNDAGLPQDVVEAMSEAECAIRAVTASAEIRARAITNLWKSREGGDARIQ